MSRLFLFVRAVRAATPALGVGDATGVSVAVSAQAVHPHGRGERVRAVIAAQLNFG
ncbi:hypothetical protein [Halomonas sp. M20]|uniref:hypothetical protein n=1 Tax=Halomonas sp. M20 TaxID=2763264 RepID=UPI001D0AD3AA|nr:hypothetical protein [Halomonas sp. M20]